MDGDYSNWRFGPPQLDPKVEALAKVLATGNNVTPPKEDGYWVRTWPGAESVNLNVVDKHPYGDEVKGWTVCDKNKKMCDILINRNADRACVEGHERRHAAGYDHPDYPRAYICPK
jgi:hypothetical protein